MKPSVWMYGGVHHDPGTRQQFLAALATQQIPPHFVAVEWEPSVFTRLTAWRPQIAEALGAHWDFLTREDCHVLSRALAWEGDAHAERFPGTDVLWLESEAQESALERKPGGADAWLQSLACDVLKRLCDPRTMAEPEPRTTYELVDRAWRTAWSTAYRAEDFERDARWAREIIARSTGLRDGWIAVVSGWAHADPAAGDQWLRSLLVTHGFEVHAVRLGP
jgi:hypothetical protein